MSLFVNYMATPARATPLNLAVARVGVGLYAAWKVSTYPFAALADIPQAVLLGEPLAQQSIFFAAGSWWRSTLPAEQALAVALLALFAAGWRLGFTAWGAALLVSHLSGLNFLAVNEKTFLLPVYFLILHGLFRETDTLTLDAWLARRKGGVTPSTAGPYPMPSLRGFLLVFSIIYFATGYAKVLGGGWSLDWAAAENIRLIVQRNAIHHIHELPPAAALIMPHDGVFAAAGLGAMFLELGFVIAVMCRMPIAPFITGLFAMHLGILLTMQLNYLADMAVFYAVFIPWDGLVAAWRRFRASRGT